MGRGSAPPLVLVADDEPSMLELVASHLRKLDEPRLDVIQASDGEEAWRLAREHLPDLVVLDVMMPGMSGWEVCRKIREDVALAHTGVVMLTGIGENLNQMTSPLYGADAYIDKPFDFGELDQKVIEALEARAPQREAVARPIRNGIGGPARAAVPPSAGEGRTTKTTKKRRPKSVVKGRKSMAAKKTAKKAAAKKTAKKGAAKKSAAKKAMGGMMGAPAAAKKTARKGAAKKTAKKGAAKKTAKKGAAKKTARKSARKSAKKAAKA
jgi:DNA-binding response OmpR family regulator